MIRFLPLLLLATLVAGIIIYQNYSTSNPLFWGPPKNAADFSEQKEDEQSMYKIPPDVLAALDEAKNSGKPVLGIRADGPIYHIPILMYHYVEYVADQNDKLRIALNTPPEVLDSEIKTLKDGGYSFINASELADILDGIKEAPPKPIMLTFDDSYSDFYTYAFPILKKYNAKAVQYVISGWLGHRDHLSEEQVKEIAQSGLVEIGAHTVHHLALAGLGETAKEEITKSKLQLEQILNTPVTALAYPYGSFDINAIQFAKQAGFRTAVSTIPGSETGNQSRYFAFRLRPGGSTGQALIDLVEKPQQ